MTTPESTAFELNGEKYTIDKYSPTASSGKRPMVVIVHGTDGMSPESGPQIHTLAQQVAAEGFVVFIPYYFNALDGADTQPIADLFKRRLPRLHSYAPRVKAGVEYALGQADADSGRVGLVGLSLGGGLAIEYAQSVGRAKVHALVVFFGYVADPSLYANAGTLPPTLVLHNEDDGIVDPEYSNKLIKALEKSRVTCHKELYHDDNPARKNHPFKPGGVADVKSRAATVDWLNMYLKPSV